MGESPPQSSVSHWSSFSSSSCGTSGSLNQRSLSWSHPEVQILRTAVCAIPAGLGLKGLHVGKSNWCVHLQTWPICAPERKQWSSVNASGEGIYSSCACSPSWSGDWSNEISRGPKWPIKVGFWQSLICRRGEWNLVWVRRKTT